MKFFFSVDISQISVILSDISKAQFQEVNGKVRCDETFDLLGLHLIIFWWNENFFIPFSNWRIIFTKKIRPLKLIRVRFHWAICNSISSITPSGLSV